ncbi:HAMP domain-containing protein [Candidatus Woesearchaeota archaeon]|nr:HAMP domain-containing protein [Candidatus Woesearchaeota archaeon]
MAKIKTSLTMSFLVVITLMLLLSLFILFYHSNVESKYKQITDNSFSLVVILAAIVFITAGCVIYALFFSNKISSPLIKLSEIAEAISKGNLELKVGDNLLKESNNEIGSLSLSFNTLINRVKNEINQQKDINKSILKISRELESKNEELKKFNRLAVGRELKMIELKKRIKELEKNHRHR